MKKWYLIHPIMAALGLWPVDYLLNPDLTRPLVFILYFSILYMIFWIAGYFLNRSYFFKVPRLFGFLWFLIKEITKSNLHIAYDILKPGLMINPAIIAVPLDVKSDLEIVTLASVITLTPGTLSLELSSDKKILYVHEMYISGKDIEASRQNIKNGFEKKIIELTI